MEKSNIEFREIKRSDYHALEKIIRDTWNYEHFCTPKTARQMSKLYLASCLSNQHFTCVAVHNDEPVGVIMVKDERRHHIPCKCAFRCLTTAAAMLASKEGRRVSKMYKGIATIYGALRKESGQSFDGELAFFAIKSDQRGTGIGKELFRRALCFMKSQNIKHFYLYTDTTCNYGFYEHQGMKRICERKYSLKPQRNEDILFYLYGYRFETKGV